jgi:short-subunit dehydrogenase
MSTIVITGASSGIGAALAEELGRRGHALGLIARREEKLAELAVKLQARGVTVAVAAADVTDRDAVFAAMETLEQRLGPLHVMVANAGIGGRLVPAQWDNDEVRRSMEVNYFGAAYCAEAVVPGMIERGRGRLVVVSSVASNRGLPGSGPYSASKAAISTLWEGLRLELKPYGVTCLTVHPGFVATPLTEAALNPQPFKMSAERASRIIANAIESRRRTLTFPWQMVVLEQLMRRMPAFVFDLFMAKRERAKLTG